MRHGSYDAKTCRAHAHAAAHKRPPASESPRAAVLAQPQETKRQLCKQKHTTNTKPYNKGRYLGSHVHASPASHSRPYSSCSHHCTGPPATASPERGRHLMPSLWGAQGKRDNFEPHKTLRATVNNPVGAWWVLGPSPPGARQGQMKMKAGYRSSLTQTGAKPTFI